MSIQIGKYNFEGPYASPAGLRNISGVYAILGTKAGKTHVADIGESQEERETALKIMIGNLAGCDRDTARSRMQLITVMSRSGCGLKKSFGLNTTRLAANDERPAGGQLPATLFLL